MTKIFRAIGLMSGTSLDGIDVALVETDGEKLVKRGAHMSVAYPPDFRALLARALHEASDLADAGARPGKLGAIEIALTRKHGEAVGQFLNCKHLLKTDIDIIGFHGQTVLHRPENKLTIQLGLGDMLARTTGIDCAYDFRSLDVSSGGQGAPLVPIYHQALASSSQLEYPLAVVNLGGVGNVTYIGEGNDIGADNEILAFDTGPGNALIDDWVMGLTGEPMDRDGGIAAKGVLDEPVLSALLENPYFAAKPPKSLDRNQFSMAPLEGMSLEDGAKTLTAFTAESLAGAVAHFPKPPKVWIISGGGAQNPTLMGALEKRLDGKVVRADDVNGQGWSAEFMEAEAFAYLAVRVKKGLPITFPSTTGVSASMTGGRIARAD